MIEDIAEPHKPWHLSPIHCLDFEGSLQSGIVEYGLITIKDLGVVSLDTRLCCGLGSISEMETATHQLRDVDVMSSEPINESWELFRDKRISGPFAAHHAGVENGLIKSVWPFTIQCYNFLSGESDVDWGPWLDTCALYRALFPDLQSYNLANLIETFELDKQLNELADQFCPPNRNTFHCASYDALASAVLLLQLENYEEIATLTLSQLMQWSQPGRGSSSANQMELL